jgi:hypothetical protein
VKPVLALAGFGGLCVTLTACGASPPPPPQAAMPKPVAAAPAPATPKPIAPAPAAPPASAPTTPSTSAPNGPAAGASAGLPAITPPGLPALPPLNPAAAAPAVPTGPAPFVAVPAVPASDGMVYDPKGRRDPFVPQDVTGGARGLQVATTKLTGIVRSARATLALVETQDGIGYILKPGDILGDGRLLEIGADNVVFVVSASPGSISNRVVLKLAAN